MRGRCYDPHTLPNRCFVVFNSHLTPVVFHQAYGPRFSSLFGFQFSPDTSRVPPR
jgi:hypothetical protein